MGNDKFKPGDKVVFTKDQYLFPFYPPKGTAGIIRKCDGDGFPLVKWDKPTLDGRRSSYVSQMDLESYVEPQKVVIWRDPHDMLRVVAKDMLTGETAEAHCHPEEQDSFNFELGAHIALGRLYGHEPAIVEMEIEKAKTPALYNGRVVCVVNGGARYWTEGKIYEIKDGVIHDDDGDEREPVCSVQELNDMMREAVDTFDDMTAFLEIKE